ncbi:MULTISPECIES: hypothetical protein [Oceanisphaera]|uniref:AMIN domain-containing protein n=1 Tax=Oceanisphaera ostreae TaxID=914151 RepID=A0ABW3KG20_9GAMM
MDSQLRLPRGGFFLLLLAYAAPAFAYEGPAFSNTPGETRQPQPYTAYVSPNTTAAQPLRFTLTPHNTFVVIPRRYGLNFELTPTTDGQQKIIAYPSLTLTPQSSLGLSLKNFRPRLDFEQGGFKTSLRLRGNGIKLNIRPTALSNRLEFDIKITDDESRLDFTYRY